MFTHIESSTKETVQFDFEGTVVTARRGETVAGALLSAGIVVFRESPVSGAPRAPYCMMGACFECLVEIDGRPNQQACMTEVAEGLKIRRQSGPAGVSQ